MLHLCYHPQRPEILRTYSAVRDAVRVQCLSILSSAEQSISNDAPAMTFDNALATLRQVRESTQEDRCAPVATTLVSPSANREVAADFHGTQYGPLALVY